MIIDICVIKGPLEPLIDDHKNRVRHGLALRILGEYAAEHVVGRGKGKPKGKILIARITDEFWQTHGVVLTAAGFKNVWPDEDKDSKNPLAPLAKLAKAMDKPVPDRKSS